MILIERIQVMYLLKVVFTLFFLLLMQQILAEKRTVIEPAIMECRYDHTAVRDTLDRSQVMKDLMILRIGKNVSQFYSWYTHYGDSLWSSPTGQRIAIKRTFEAIRTKNFENKPGERTPGYIYKSYPEKGKTTTYVMLVEPDLTLQKKPACLYFSEETPEQIWEVQDSTKQIAGYSCQLAVTRFRGRLWYAWFSLEIPVNNGPWKLCGLPGLIVEAYDNQNYYHYTLTSIRTKDVEPVIFYNYWNAVFEKTTRLNYLKRERKLITQYREHLKYTQYDFLESDYHE